MCTKNLYKLNMYKLDNYQNIKNMCEREYELWTELWTIIQFISLNNKICIKNVQKHNVLQHLTKIINTSSHLRERIAIHLTLQDASNQQRSELHSDLHPLTPPPPNPFLTRELKWTQKTRLRVTAAISKSCILELLSDWGIANGNGLVETKSFLQWKWFGGN